MSELAEFVTVLRNMKIAQSWNGYTESAVLLAVMLGIFCGKKQEKEHVFGFSLTIF